MSDSDDLSTPANFPADSVIEECLRRIVRRAVDAEEDITVNSARTQTETELGLDSGFLKDNVIWKKRSKDVINAAFQDDGSQEKTKDKPLAKAGVKRKSDEAEAQKPKKARKSNELSKGKVQAKPSKDTHAIPTDNGESKSSDETPLSEPPDDESDAAPAITQRGKAPEDESDFSDVIDDPPPKKKPRKKSSSPVATKSKSTKPASKPSNSTKATAKEKGKDLSADEEEIKRLQSWLMKCGVRKLWHRELAPYSASKEKIQHLKKMLDDVGMTPRYSVEKARQIKEARELKEELEAARQFNEQWGDGGGSGDDEDGQNKTKEEEPPPKRLRPKGLIDFGDSDEDSE